MSMTVNPASVVDEDAFTVRRSIRIEAPVATVWAAVTQPDLISQWFGRADFTAADGSSATQAAPGATGSITWPDRDPVPVRVESVDEPRLVAYRWVNPCLDEAIPAAVDEAHSTVFTFTLEPLAGGTATELTVVETGFDTMSRPAEHMESHRGGWNGELDKLVALLETGSASTAAVGAAPDAGVA